MSATEVAKPDTSGKQSRPPKYARLLKEFMEECTKHGIPHVALAVNENGTLEAGYKGAPEILEQALLVVADNIQKNKVKRNRMATLVGPDGQAVSGQKEEQDA